MKIFLLAFLMDTKRYIVFETRCHNQYISLLFLILLLPAYTHNHTILPHFSELSSCAGLRVCGFAGLRVCGFAGLRVCGFTGLRVCGFAGLRVCGFAGLRVCGCAGFGQRYLARVVVRVRGVRATLAGWCGGAGARGSGNVIRLVWSISRLVGAGAREPAGSRFRYLAGGWCGFAGLRARGFAGSRLRYPAGMVDRVLGVQALYLVGVVDKLAGGCRCANPQTRGNLQVAFSGWCGCAGFLLCLLVGALWVGICGHVLLHHHASLRDGIFSCVYCTTFILHYTILYCSVKTVYGTQNTCKSHRGCTSAPPM